VCPACPQESVFEGIDSRSVGFSADGKYLAAVGQKTPKARKQGELLVGQGMAKVWDLATGQEVLSYLNDDLEATSLSFSPVEPLLAVSFQRKWQAEIDLSQPQSPVPVIIWDLEKGKVRHKLMHEEPIDCLCFSPEGKTLATTTFRRAAYEMVLWDVKSGERGR